ncbi:unnamed protein product, partial [Iphiclides podalirius]
MKKYCVFFLFVLITQDAFGFGLRGKRQTEEKSETELEDRYGWNRPFYPREPQRPNQPSFGQRPYPEFYPGQNLYPGQRQFPNSGFPDQGRFPNPGQIPDQELYPGQQTTTQRPIDGSSTPADSDPAVQDCIRSCPVTAEYNPVCGTNSVTYPNPGRLMCAQACGVSVNLLRSSPCPSTTTATPV